MRGVFFTKLNSYSAVKSKNSPFGQSKAIPFHSTGISRLLLKVKAGLKMNRSREPDPRTSSDQLFQLIAAGRVSPSSQDLEKLSPEQLCALRKIMRITLSQHDKNRLSTEQLFDFASIQSIELTQHDRNRFLQHEEEACLTQTVQNLREIAETIDLPKLKQKLDLIEVDISRSVPSAIGGSKELVESVCKTILNDRSVEFADDEDMSALFKKTRMHLQLIPPHVPSPQKGNQTTKKVLSSLSSIVQGLAELRNNYGSGHGRDIHDEELPERHARLAVNAACTLATFLIETHEAQSNVEGK